MTNKRNTATETYITYAPETDMTFIMKGVIDADTLEHISDECIGWSYGKITISEALNMTHSLKAVYVDDVDMDVDSKATENMEYFRELFLEEALRFAAQNDGFDAYEALDQALDCDDICNDIHRATNDEIPNIVEFAADHYIW